jgi:flagellar hook-associated protein 1 FlgK
MVNVATLENADGSVNVYLSNGDPLVQGIESHPLSVELDSSGLSNVYSDNLTHAPINSLLTGGKLGAYIELQGSIIPACISDINEFASSLAASVNDLHRTGFDVYKNTGLDFFTIDADPDKAAATISVNAAIVADVNRIAASASVTQDGEMASRIAAVRDEMIMNGNTATLNSFLSTMVGQIGQRAASAKTDNDHQTAMLNNLTNQRESISGVSIDEEMINLIKYQMGYNAAGKLVKTTTDMLETLMGLLR